MRHWISLMMTVVWLGPSAVLAQAPSGQGRIAQAQEAERSEEEQASREERMDAARQRLEEAAREIAELGAELGTELGKNAVQMVQKFHVGERKAMLGINIGGPDDDDEEGVRVFGVTPGGPADDAGLRSGDVLTSIDGVSLRGDKEGRPTGKLLRFMRDVEAGDTVTVEYRRDGGVQIASLITEDLEPSAFAFGFGDHDFEFHLPDGMGGMHGFERFHSRWGSMELASLSPGLGEYFGTDEGLLVVRAPEDADLELRDGDVIIAIDGRRPKSPSHAMRILRSYQDGERLSVEIVRRQRRLTLDIELEERETDYRKSRLRIPPPLPPPPTGHAIRT